MCVHVSQASDRRVGPFQFIVNECPKGIYCENAHSVEEIQYHPNRYKHRVCDSVHSKTGSCLVGDVCPHLHPPDSVRTPKKQADNRPQGSRHPRKGESASVGTKSTLAQPTGAPIVYASPAPFSSFERHLLMPGLQALFRRHSSVVRAHVRSPGKCQCFYSCFGDDSGVSLPLPQQAKTVSSGLPSTRRV